MWKTVARRLLIMIPQLFILSILIFVAAYFMPGDALSGQIAADHTLTPEVLAELRRLHGLDDPMHIRYLRWMGNALRGDFGVSQVLFTPVLDVVRPRIMNTVRLSMVGIIGTFSLSIPLGIISGRWNGKWPERVISAYQYFGVALPGIVLSFMLLWLFSFRLGWFPTSGSQNIMLMSDAGAFRLWLDRIHHVILPAAATSLFGAVGIVQYLRNDIVDARNSDYVLLARSKGAPINVIYNKHILRNSILPIVSTIGFTIVGLFSGTVIIEGIFGFPGMGQLFISSINSRDFSVINFLVMFYAVMGILGGLLSDIALTIFDPRIRIK